MSRAEARIVANSKALHHILPNLVPPIDRTYTFTFFYNRNMLTISEEEAFVEMLTCFHKVAVKNNVGYIVSMAGFQSGAFKASELTNVELVTWNQFHPQVAVSGSGFIYWGISGTSYPYILVYLDYLP